MFRHIHEYISLDLFFSYLLPNFGAFVTMPLRRQLSDVDSGQALALLNDGVTVQEAENNYTKVGMKTKKKVVSFSEGEIGLQDLNNHLSENVCKCGKWHQATSDCLFLLTVRKKLTGKRKLKHNAARAFKSRIVGCKSISLKSRPVTESFTIIAHHFH